MDLNTFGLGDKHQEPILFFKSRSVCICIYILTNSCRFTLIGGAAASILKGRGALQDIDQMSLFKPLCKYCATVTSVRDIVPVVRRALQEAQSGTPGKDLVGKRYVSF